MKFFSFFLGLVNVSYAYILGSFPPPSPDLGSIIRILIAHSTDARNGACRDDGYNRVLG